MNWNQAKVRYPKLSPFKDADKDGVKNWLDCKPFDKKRHMTKYKDPILKRTFPTKKLLMTYGRPEVIEEIERLNYEEEGARGPRAMAKWKINEILRNKKIVPMKDVSFDISDYDDDIEIEIGSVKKHLADLEKIRSSASDFDKDDMTLDFPGDEYE